MAKKTLPVLQGVLAKFTEQEAIPKGQKREIDGITVTGTGEPYYAWKRPGGRAMMILNPRDGTVQTQSSEGARDSELEAAEHHGSPDKLTDDQKIALAEIIGGFASTLEDSREYRNRLPEGFFNSARTTLDDLFFEDGRRYQKSGFELEDVEDVDPALEGDYIRVRDWKTGAPDPSDPDYLNDFEPLHGRDWMRKYLVKEITTGRKTIDQAVGLDRHRTIFKLSDDQFITNEDEVWIFDSQQRVWRPAQDLPDSVNEGSSDTRPSGPPVDRDSDNARVMEENLLKSFLDRELTFQEMKEFDRSNFIDGGDDDRVYLQSGEAWLFNHDTGEFEYFRPRDQFELDELHDLQDRQDEFDEYTDEQKKTYNDKLFDRFTRGKLTYLQAKERDVFDFFLWGNDTHVTHRDGAYYRTIWAPEEYLPEKRWCLQKRALLLESDPMMQNRVQEPNYRDINPFNGPFRTHKPKFTKKGKEPVRRPLQVIQASREGNKENINTNNNNAGSAGSTASTRTSPLPPPGGKTTFDEAAADRKRRQDEAAADRQRRQDEADQLLALQRGQYDRPREITLGGRTWAGPRPQAAKELTDEERDLLGDGPRMSRFGIDRSSPELETSVLPPPAEPPKGAKQGRKPARGGKGGRKLRGKENGMTTNEESEQARNDRRDAAKRGAETRKRNREAREAEREELEDGGEGELEGGEPPVKSRKTTGGRQTRSRARGE
ncbi:MAG: hypothetical protein M1835_006759 [Candelina submexicana]|nr:MAG: hypothetical protein M1835_006759 [Candelina submexicana]